MKNNELYIVIPAYEPDFHMIDLLNRLEQTFLSFHIIIVDDGSKHAADIFEKAKTYHNVKILTHERNYGKGKALRTAFDYIKTYKHKHHIIVTCDADGQHDAQDIQKVVDYYDKTQKGGLVLGSRELGKDVPFRSKFGNEATKFLFRLVNSHSLHDNQTGLRCFGSELLPLLLEVKGDRYEYEMNMLVECSRRDISIDEVKIHTIYIEKNRASHFRPVRDFLKICKNILKYALPNLITILIDIAIFALAFIFYRMWIDDENLLIFLACITGAIISYFANSLMNLKNFFYGNPWIFESKKKRKHYFLYGVLAVIVRPVIICGIFLLVSNLAKAKILGDGGCIITFLVLKYLLAPKIKRLR